MVGWRKELLICFRLQHWWDSWVPCSLVQWQWNMDPNKSKPRNIPGSPAGRTAGWKNGSKFKDGFPRIHWIVALYPTIDEILPTIELFKKKHLNLQDLFYVCGEFSSKGTLVGVHPTIPWLKDLKDCQQSICGWCIDLVKSYILYGCFQK